MGKKENNEITVKVNGALENLYNILQNKQFKIVKKFSLDDTYFIPQNLEISKLSTREILSKAILVRAISLSIPSEKIEKKLTLKKKEIDFEGNIINQEAINCDVFEIEDAKKFIEAIGYHEIMQIKEKDIVFEKDGFQLAVKDIENGDKLIEIETNFQNPKFDTIEKLKQKMMEIDIPVYLDNYFVKKAEIALDRVLKR